MAGAHQCDALHFGEGHPLRGLDPRRRHLPQRAERGGRLSESSLRVRQGGPALSALQRRLPNRADGPGPAVDVLLPRLSTEIEREILIAGLLLWLWWSSFARHVMDQLQRDADVADLD